MDLRNLFGYVLKKKNKKQQETPNSNKSFVEPHSEDGAVTVETGAGGAYGTYIDFAGLIKNEYELITKYRQMSLQPECDIAIDDVINDLIVTGEKESPAKIVPDDIEFSDKIKKTIIEEFEYILQLLNFKEKAYDIARKWYIDGRLYYHIIMKENPIKGISELRYIDPRQIRKIREIEKEPDRSSSSSNLTANLVSKINEYYVYNESGIFNGSGSYTADSTTGLKISKDAVVYVHSGITDSHSKMVLSNLHKAIKPLNQLRMIEDATVIYRIARAPERRIFYIDVGNMPNARAEEYLRKIATKYRNKMVYNSANGEISDSNNNLSMLEDFWLPRKDGCLSLDTKIPLLDGRTLTLEKIIEEQKRGKINWVYSCSEKG